MVNLVEHPETRSFERFLVVNHGMRKPIFIVFLTGPFPGQLSFCDLALKKGTGSN
jgi:hypothetical protein